MGGVRFYDNKVLFAGGAVAMHEDCCCVWTGTCGDCNCSWDGLPVSVQIVSNKEPYPEDPVDLETCVASESIAETDTAYATCFWMGERTVVACKEVEGAAEWGLVVGFTIYTWRAEHEVWQESWLEVKVPLSLTSCDGLPSGSGSTWVSWESGCHIDIYATVG